MSYRIEGLDGVLAELQKLGDPKRVNAAMGKCCLEVERTARQKAGSAGIKDKGGLSQSIHSKVEVEGSEIKGVIYSNAHYAPYVEYGTGIHAEEGGRSGYWVFVKDGTSNKKKKKSKTYTLDEAKRVMAYLRSKDLEAYYTNGRKATPFLRPAIEENREKIINILKESIRND